MLAAKQIQPMKDREMGTKMAMLQPSTGLLMFSSYLTHFQVVVVHHLQVVSFTECDL